MSDHVGNEFHQELLRLLPRLRGYALSLAGDRDRADDLVQGTVVKALARRETFVPGTNLAAWIFRIQRNLFFDEFRRRRPTVELDQDVASRLGYPPTQEDALLKAEFATAFGRLSAVQREALTLSVIEGLTYEEIAARAGVAIGTIKSRVSRARDSLLQLMTGDSATQPVSSGPGRQEAPRNARLSAVVSPPE